MLQKTLEKVFITKECTQWKTWRTLKIDVFEILDNKSIGKCFTKFELLFLDQANSSSDSYQILRLPTPRVFQPPSPYLSNFSPAHYNHFEHNPRRVFHWSPCLVLTHLTTCYHKYWRYQTVQKTKPIYYQAINRS